MAQDNDSDFSALEGYVFIVTYGRSGSTMLQNVLNAIPGYLIRGENENTLLHLARAWMTVRDSQEIKVRREAMQGGQKTADTRYGKQIDPWYGAELIRPPKMGRALAELFTRHVLNPLPETRVTGFKEIRFHHAGDDLETYLDFLLFFFPNSRIVFNTRNLDDVAKSGWWTSYDPDAFTAEVGSADRRFRAYAAGHQQRTIHMHYDDYRASPEAFERLFDFLGEPFDLQKVRAAANERLDHLKD